MEREALFLSALMLLTSPVFAYSLVPAYYDLFYTYPVLKIKGDCQNYFLVVHFIGEDDASYCCGKAYYLVDDKVKVYKVYGMKTSDMLALGTIELDSNYNAIVASNDSITVCNYNYCETLDLEGHVIWRADVGIGKGWHLNLYVYKGYLIVPYDEGLHILDVTDGTHIADLKLGGLRAFDLCKNKAVIVRDLGDNRALLLLDMSNIMRPKVLWNFTRAWYVDGVSFSTDCKYVLANDIWRIYVFSTDGGKMLASRDVASGNNAITASKMCKYKDKYLVLTTTADLNLLQYNIGGSLDVSDILNIGKTYVAFYAYIFTK